MTLKHGLSEYSAECVAIIGAATMLLQQDYKTVQSFMELALAIQDTIGRARSSKTTQVTQLLGLAWTQPISKSLSALGNGYIVGMQMGETAAGIWNLVFQRVVLPLFLGHPLDHIQRDCPKVLAQAEDVAQQDKALVVRFFWQIMINLSDPSKSNRTRLEGEVVDPKKHKSEGILPLAAFWLSESMLLLFFSEYEAAAQSAVDKWDYYSKSVPGVASNMEETFHRAISLYAAARKTKKSKFKKAAIKLQKRILGWEKSGNPNVRHIVLVLEAEAAALSNKLELAKAKYEEAIKIASKDGCLQYVALFNERYADYLSQNPSSGVEGGERRSMAIEAYREWGAHAKVADMLGEL